MTQQLALDFSTGAGADVSAFDGFLIPPSSKVAS